MYGYALSLIVRAVMSENGGLLLCQEMAAKIKEGLGG